jgi:hypothetical protein
MSYNQKQLKGEDMEKKDLSLEDIKEIRTGIDKGEYTLVVGEGASYVANRRIYGPGEEINPVLFKNDVTFKVAISSGKLKLVKADTGDGADTTGEDNSGGADTGGGDPGGGDTSGSETDTTGGDTTITPKKRKAMEKAAVDNSLGNSEEIKNLSDQDLTDLLTAAGLGV